MVPPILHLNESYQHVFRVKILYSLGLHVQQQSIDGGLLAPQQSAMNMSAQLETSSHVPEMYVPIELYTNSTARIAPPAWSDRTRQSRQNVTKLHNRATMCGHCSVVSEKITEAFFLENRPFIIMDVEGAGTASNILFCQSKSTTKARHSGAISTPSSTLSHRHGGWGSLTKLAGPRRWLRTSDSLHCSVLFALYLLALLCACVLRTLVSTRDHFKQDHDHSKSMHSDAWLNK